MIRTVRDKMYHQRSGQWWVFTLSLAMLLAPTTTHAKRRSPTKQKMTVPGTLLIYSMTTDAEVEIDGKAVGKIPLDDDFAVEAGQHTIRVWKRGYSEHNDTFTVASAEDVELEIDLIPIAGVLRISTPNPGATVLVNGKATGVTPFDREVHPGKTLLAVRRDGFFEEVRELTVVAGQNYEFDLELKPMPGATASGQQEPAAVYETWWFWTVMGVALAGGAAAIALANTTGNRAAQPPNTAINLYVE
jgi:hypothetical protein